MCQCIRETSPIDEAIKGFKATGLWPFSDEILTDEGFTAAQLTEEEPLTATSMDSQVS